MEERRSHTETKARPKAGDGCTGLDNVDEPLKCVFSTVTEIQIGTGETAKKQKNRLLWYVKQRQVDEFGVRKINPQFVPVGDETFIDQETLLAEYTPEVEIHNSQVEPARRALQKTLAKGDKYREKGQPLSAEMEYEKAIDVDETNVRAIFGLGLVYLSRNDRERSIAVFEQLVSMNAAFALQHKHLFNEFGIALRKSELYEEAIQYYSRAVELTSDDENLYYNLARVFYEQNDWEHCYQFAAKCLEIDPDHEHALSLCKIMSTFAANERLRIKHGKPPIPEDVAKQVACQFMECTAEFEPMVELGPDGLGIELSGNGETFDF